jgi:hypothetical protein
MFLLDVWGLDNLISGLLLTGVVFGAFIAGLLIVNKKMENEKY